MRCLEVLWNLIAWQDFSIQGAHMKHYMQLVFGDSCKQGAKPSIQIYEKSWRGGRSAAAILGGAAVVLLQAGSLKSG